MGTPAPLHSVYVGIARDMARDAIPPGYVWNLQDFIPSELGAPIEKRGGWTYASSAISSASYVDKVAFGELTGFTTYRRLIAIAGTSAASAGMKVYVVDEDTGAVTSAGAITSSSAGSAASGYRIGDVHVFGSHFFIPVGWMDGNTGNPSASSLANQYDGSNVQNIVSSYTADGPAGARYATDFRSYLVLGSTPAHPSRIFFSDPGIIDSATFSDVNAWIDMSFPITGMASLANVLLIFSDLNVQRIRGTAPPPDSDMFIDTLSDYGCVDHRSIAEWNGQIVYADTKGVYMTDGINTVDLTESGLIKSYYRTMLSGYVTGPWTTTGWTLRGGIFRGYYFLTILNDAGEFEDCLVCDIRRRTWFRMQNFLFRDFCVSATDSARMFAACSETNKVADVTPIFYPVADNKADADGTAVLPVVEYPMRRSSLKVGRSFTQTNGLSHFKRLYLSYDLRDAASDNPVLTLSYVTTPEASSYTALAYTLPETTTFARAGRSFGPLGERGGITEFELGVKVTQTNASSVTKVYTLEGEMEAVESSGLVQ